MVLSRAPYEVGAVANFMIGRARQQRRLLTNLKLQKLVYISYGIHLVVMDKRLFRSRIEAWRYGPVIPELYHEFKRFGSGPIRSWSMDFDYENERFRIPKIPDDDEGASLALEATWDVYHPLRASNLVELTHAEDTPWDRAYQRGRGSPIDDRDVRTHYQALLDGWREEVPETP